MKLCNKKTGEVGLLRNIAFSLLGDVATIQLIIEIDGYNISKYYHTLNEVYAEWEDYNENRVQIKIEKRPLEERLLNLEIKMADAEDDIAMLNDKIVELCGRKNKCKL